MMTLKSPAEYFTSPEPCSALADVRKQMEEESLRNTIDPIQLRAQQDWSAVLGREIIEE